MSNLVIMYILLKTFPSIHPLFFSVQLQVIEGLDALVNLEKLFLGKNKISKIEVECWHSNHLHLCFIVVSCFQQNLDKLVKLRCLSLQCNRLTVIQGLDTLVNLEELYLSDNGIAEIQGLRNLVNNSNNLIRDVSQ